MSVSRTILSTIILVTGLLASAQLTAQTDISDGRSAQASAGFVQVPADISTEMTAQPSSGLVPGQPIVFTIAVTNHGPMPVDSLLLLSSDFFNEFDLNSASTDCAGVGIIITDGDGFFYYTIAYYPTDQGILEVGESRTCHLTLALSNQAPASLPFSFGVAYFYEDINPDNNVATVILRRGDIAPVELPALSPYTFILLITALSSMAWLALIRRRVGSASDDRQ